MRAGLNAALGRLAALVMSLNAGQAALLCPTAVAVHHDGDMVWEPEALKGRLPISLRGQWVSPQGVTVTLGGPLLSPRVSGHCQMMSVHSRTVCLASRPEPRKRWP